MKTVRYEICTEALYMHNIYINPKRTGRRMESTPPPFQQFLPFTILIPETSQYLVADVPMIFFLQKCHLTLRSFGTASTKII